MQKSWNGHASRMCLLSACASRSYGHWKRTGICDWWKKHPISSICIRYFSQGRKSSSKRLVFPMKLSAAQIIVLPLNICAICANLLKPRRSDTCTPFACTCSRCKRAGSPPGRDGLLHTCPGRKCRGVQVSNPPACEETASSGTPALPKDIGTMWRAVTGKKVTSHGHSSDLGVFHFS